jgi:hypothetical protein
MRLLKDHLRKSKNTGIRRKFDSISCFETRSLLITRSYPRHFTLYLGNPFP